jgi:hypothetical protein
MAAITPQKADISKSADDDTAVAIYIASLTADLAGLARRQGLDTLGYLLDMARLEADNVTREANGERRAG